MAQTRPSGFCGTKLMWIAQLSNFIGAFNRNLDSLCGLWSVRKEWGLQFIPSICQTWKWRQALETWCNSNPAGRGNTRPQWCSSCSRTKFLVRVAMKIYNVLHCTAVCRTIEGSSFRLHPLHGRQKDSHPCCSQFDASNTSDQLTMADICCDATKLSHGLSLNTCHFRSHPPAIPISRAYGCLAGKLPSNSFRVDKTDRVSRIRLSSVSSKTWLQSTTSPQGHREGVGLVMKLGGPKVHDHHKPHLPVSSMWPLSFFFVGNRNSDIIFKKYSSTVTLARKQLFNISSSRLSALFTI
ncbi:hypothetical protein VFPPC_16535 [Pochonia chlamydosporia 170]|uniref:Uncharacterized protein n=1 Tax=Pochonia chlamydosporia 170 TaxID=1380566 RepID=A0A179F822_METCM|nr:hypothetical protein VFPPC_16535 [Pochonia chlamydosporia 170]OAQ61634.2 hypothetical protein VFPPC_16535 [Pochonia chlamydosporia 170]